MPASHGFMFAFTTRITSFFKKNAEKVCQLKKNAYLCTRFKTKWTFSSAGLEYLSDRQGVDGSNPPTPTKQGCFPEWPNGADCKSAVFRLRWFESISTHEKTSCGNSSVDRALAFQAGGRGFESRFPLHVAVIAQW